MDKKWLKTSAGIEMPPLIYGTAWKKERTADLAVKAVEAGFRGIDTAGQPRHYSEQLVGEAVCRLADMGIERESLFLQTKFTPLPGQDPNRVPYDSNADIDVQVAQSFDVSKKNLQTDYIDSFVLHSPLAPHSQLMKAWQAMEDIHAAGEAGQLGISNCYDIETLKMLYKDASVKPAIVQNRFYQETGYDIGLRKWCADNGLLYQSFWTLTANPHLLASNTVQNLVQKYNKTEPQILFRYLSQSGVVPLTGTCSAQHMREDLSIFDFELSDDDLKNMNKLIAAA